MNCVTIKLINPYSKPSEEIFIFTIKKIEFKLKFQQIIDKHLILNIKNMNVFCQTALYFLEFTSCYILPNFTEPKKKFNTGFYAR